MQGLIEGRVVHYVMSDDIHSAAVVVQVKNQVKGVCDLVVFLSAKESEGHGITPGVPVYAHNVPYNPDGTETTWHWIEGSKGA